MEERAKRRAQGLKTLPDVPDSAIPSLDAASTALEKFQAEHMATLGSVSEPLARAQELVGISLAFLLKREKERRRF